MEKTQKFPEWDRIFELQKFIQEEVYGYDFKRMTLKDLSNFWLMNKHALEDELSEMFVALGGEKDGIGNAVWKPWKREHYKADQMHVRDLSPEDKKLLLFEIVDAFHFLINFAVSCEFTGSDVASAYIIKNKENIKRQVDGY